MAALIEQIEGSLPAEWARDHGAESRIRAATSNAWTTSCFTCSQNENRPSATLFLTQSEVGIFHVSNILPNSKDQLVRGEYNAILEEFYQQVLRPLADQVGVMTTLTKSHMEPEDWMSPATATKLRGFSPGSNNG